MELQNGLWPWPPGDADSSFRGIPRWIKKMHFDFILVRFSDPLERDDEEASLGGICMLPPDPGGRRGGGELCLC